MWADVGARAHVRPQTANRAEGIEAEGASIFQTGRPSKRCTLFLVMFTSEIADLLRRPEHGTAD
jgi:hypothetical protein